MVINTPSGYKLFTGDGNCSECRLGVNPSKVVKALIDSAHDHLVLLDTHHPFISRDSRAKGGEGCGVQEEALICFDRILLPPRNQLKGVNPMKNQLIAGRNGTTGEHGSTRSITE